MPAIVGVGQVVQRPGEVALDDARGPIDLMVDAALAAAADAGAGSLLSKVGMIGVAGGWFTFRNPGQLIARRIGAPAARSVLTSISGTTPQDLVGLASERIARGEIDVALVVGGEARWSEQRIKRAGGQPPWAVDESDEDPELISSFPAGLSSEGKVFGGAPAAYALFEDRHRHTLDHDVDTHRDRLAALWAGFSAVASSNPYAWDRQAHPAAEIREATPDNRMIAFPYTKAMVANNTVDMATAVLLCSVDAARAAGLSNDRLVFPSVITNGHETWMVAERRRLDGAPALTTAARVAFERSATSIDDIAHIDLYACFPSIVQMSASALGIHDDRALTVTGGLGFAGAPVGNAVGHSIAAMVERVRTGGLGLVHANGGMATKQSFGIYSDQPPDAFTRIDVQDEVELDPRGTIPEGWAGAVVVEAATVAYDRDGPSHVLAAVLDDDGRRGWATSRDPAHVATVESTGIVGLPGRRAGDGELRL
ncbi:MAG: hypothetical protein ABW328_02470 [Ilumatobacteraceae bacterium]